MASGNRTVPSCEEKHIRRKAVSTWISPEVIHSLHRSGDSATGIILCSMVVFSPWAFGTTEPWSIWVMNIGGAVLGLILLGKWALRWSISYRPQTWGDSENEPDSNEESLEANSAQSCRPAKQTARYRLIIALALLTVLILGYCLVSAVNARSTLSADYLQLEYRHCISWLPHSYDAKMTWEAFWKYLGLAAVFWSVRDWLMVKTRVDRTRLREEGASAALGGGCFVPRRLELLLWIVCLNGALLASQGLLQRALGGGKLLWLVEPHINKTAESQFGPYAYRSNAAQFFLLAWPMAVGFWLVLRRRAHYLAMRLKAHNNLLPCILVMAMVPLMSLSRAGAVVGGLSILVALGLVLSNMGRHRKAVWGIVGLLGAALLLGTYMEWQQLDSRFRQDSIDSRRFEIWRTAWQTVRDFPVFGTGPGTFSSVYQWYRPSVDDEWSAFAHNDWLETLMTFGAVGSALILLALGVVFALRFVGKGVYLHRLFAQAIYVGLGSCIIYAIGDFPFQVHSVLFLFVLECAILSCLSRRGLPQSW